MLFLKARDESRGGSSSLSTSTEADQRAGKAPEISTKQTEKGRGAGKKALQ
jgi:hypothetical protein